MVRIKGITKKKVTISLDIDLHNKLRDKNLNISGIINILLKDFLDKLDKNN